MAFRVAWRGLLIAGGLLFFRKNGSSRTFEEDERRASFALLGPLTGTQFPSPFLFPPRCAQYLTEVNSAYARQVRAFSN
jgi:hypothetical protein